MLFSAPRYALSFSSLGLHAPRLIASNHNAAAVNLAAMTIPGDLGLV
jgi:hypothetical protein